VTNAVEQAIKAGQTPGLDELRALLLNDPTDKIITGDEVQFHPDRNDKRIVLPQGTGFNRAISILQRKQAEQEEATNFTRIFKYRYPDGAYAMTQVLKATYGLTLAKGQQTMFGTRPAETMEVTIGVGKTVTCLWGTVEIPALQGAEIYLTGTHDRKHGVVFACVFTGPRKHKAEAEKLFDLVDEYLKVHSIYRGHALAGAEELEFMDLRTFDARQVVFSAPVNEALENLLFGPIRNAELFRGEGIPLKRALLFHGPFGTGKTSIGMITAQVAEQNGWTFITARPGDKVADVLRTAVLYQPAVVLVEDIETESSSSDPRAVSQLLDAFDGATSKGTEIIMVLTSNHIEQIHKGMLRPGRIDATIEVAALDRTGVEGLIKAVVNPMKLDDAVDYDEVYAAMDGFLPAFVKAAIDRAKTWSLVRGGKDYVLTTEDLAGAAMSLHDQLARMNDAKEGQREPELQRSLETLVKDQVTKIVNHTEVTRDGDEFGELAVTEH
jgi:transitional endoplasmic reticulum ATPase